MKNKVTLFFVITLIVIFIGSTISLAFMIENNEELPDPTEYASIYTIGFGQFDLEINAQDLVDELIPFAEMFEDMIDEEYLKLLEFDYSFLDLAGFFSYDLTDDFTESIVFGLRLSGAENTEDQIKDLLDYLSELSLLDVVYDDDGYITIEIEGEEIVIFQAEEYLLASMDKESIDYVTDLKDSDKEKIIEKENWKKVESELSKNFSFFVEIPDFFGGDPIPLAGTYVNPNKNEYGLELILIDGRDNFDKIFSFDPTGEMAKSMNSLFDSAKDLSETISYLPETGIRTALSGIIHFNEYYELEIINGENGIWIDLEDAYLSKQGASYRTDDLEPKEFLLKVYPESKYHYEKTEDGYELYMYPYFFNPIEDEFDITDEIPDFYCQIVDDKLYVVSDESMKQDEWTATEVSPIEESVMYLEVDYSKLVKMALSDSSYPGMDPDIFAGFFEEAGIMLKSRLYEKDTNIRLNANITGDFELLSDMIENILP